MATRALAAIHIHPVKSCRAIALESVEVSVTGLADDRRYQVVDELGDPVTQRQAPALATVQPSLIDGGLRLTTDGATIEVAQPETNDVTVNALLGIAVDAADCGDEAASWFAALLGRRCRLVALTGGSELRLPLPGIDARISWVDAVPVLVTTSASLGWLAERASEPFGMDRFRPNLTVQTNEPWEEDTWRTFTIGHARLGFGLAWPRCAIPQVDQTTGERHVEPARVLRDHRWCASAPTVDATLRLLLEGNPLFGIGCTIGPPGTRVAVGDVVEVQETGSPIVTPPTL